jgi:hypothetical protein
LAAVNVAYEADGDGDSRPLGLSMLGLSSGAGLVSDGLSSPPGLVPLSDGVHAARAAAAARASTAINRFITWCPPWGLDAARTASGRATSGR